MEQTESVFATAALPPKVRTLVGERPLEDLVRMLGPCPEETLATLIDADGRARLDKGLTFTLDDYLTAIPSLTSMTVALDAAIDMALRSLAGASAPTQKTVELLIQRFPNLETAIREAAMLGHALHTAPTPRVRPSRYAGRLPCDIGPTLPDGRPQYVLQRLLGRGAFGEVYLAQDRHLSDDDRPALVAIKVLVDDPENLGLRYRLADEATKARRVDHPNVVRVIARAQAESGDEFVVYEYVEGPNLQDHVRRLPARMTPRDAALLVVQIARGIHAAHLAGLVHRDLKPGNVLIDASGRPRITDFGVAVRDRSGFSPPSADQSGQAGTLAFMAPEQFSARLGAVGPPADVFAIAGILIWLLTGRPPYGATPDEITKAHLEASTGVIPATLEEALASIDPTLAHIARSALDSKPERRYASASQFADELTCWLELRPVPSMNLPAHAQVALWARRRPSLAAAVLVASLTLITGGVTTVWLRSIARDKAEEARIAQIRVEEEEKRRKIAADALTGYSVFIDSLADRSVPEAIGQIYMTYELFGPTGINVGEQIKILSEGRLRVANERLAQAARPTAAPPSSPRTGSPSSLSGTSRKAAPPSPSSTSKKHAPSSRNASPTTPGSPTSTRSRNAPRPTPSSLPPPSTPPPPRPSPTTSSATSNRSTASRCFPQPTPHAECSRDSTPPPRSTASPSQRPSPPPPPLPHPRRSPDIPRRANATFTT